MKNTICVKLYASLAEYKPVEAESPEFELDIDAGMTVEQVIAKLHIPAEKIKMMSLNNTLVKNTATLTNEDRLVLFSTIAGG